MSPSVDPVQFHADNFQIFLLILIVSAVEFSPPKASYAADNSSSSKYVSSSSIHFYFSLFPNKFQYFLSKIPLLLLFFRLFCRIDIVFFVKLI